MIEQPALVLLAAGRGRRFGHDKRRALFNGAPLLRWTFDRLSPAAPCTIVTGIGTQDLLHGRSFIAVPGDPDDMGASIAAALAAVPPACPAAIVVPADMPLLTAAHLTALAQTAVRHADGWPVASVRDPSDPGRAPVLWPRALFHRFAGASGDGAGRRALEAGPYHRVAFADPDEADDADTPEDLARLQTLLHALESGRTTT